MINNRLLLVQNLALCSNKDFAFVTALLKLQYSKRMAGYKVVVDILGRGQLQVGIVAESLVHLKKQIQEEFRIEGDIHVYLEDGTLVNKEDYFKILEPQTKLRIKG